MLRSRIPAISGTQLRVFRNSLTVCSSCNNIIQPSPALHYNHHHLFRSVSSSTHLCAASSPIPRPSPSEGPSNIPASPAANLSPVWSHGAGHLAGLGQGDYKPRLWPTPIHALRGSQITHISSSWGRNAAVTAGGSVFVWGWKPVMRSLLLTAKYMRRMPWFVKFLQAFPLGRWSMQGGDPLMPHRLLHWGKEDYDPALEEGDENPKAVSVSAGSDWIAILSDEGQVYTMGAGFYGQLGHSSAIEETLLSQPRMVCRYQNQHPNESHGKRVESDQFRAPSFPNSPIIQVATGFSHMLLLTKNGQVYACGKTSGGCLGITHIYRDGKRLFFPHLIPVTDAYAAGEHGAGEVNIKMSAVDKQKAQSNSFLRANNDPAIVDHYIGPIVQVAAGMKHSLFLNAQGEVYGCGTNGLNELGNNTYHAVHGLIRIRLPLKAGDESAASIRRRKRLQPVEDSNEGFFGHDASSAAEKIVKIVAGNHHSLALSNYGHVYAWGLNEQGQCGVPCLTQAEEGRTMMSAVSLKKKEDNNDDAEENEAEAVDSTPSTPVKTTSVTRLEPSSNPARRQAMSDKCVSPLRIRLNEAELGVSKQQMGAVVDIIAGFHDSVLITDRGYCIMFGGGLNPHTQHKPFVFRLDRPTPLGSVVLSKRDTQQHERSDASQPEMQEALKSPYRVKQMAFGLGHMLTLLENKPLGGR